MLTFNVNDHSFLSRLHRPEKDRISGDVLPLERQDKRAHAHVEPQHWFTWLHGDPEEAHKLLVAPPVEFFDQTDAQRTAVLLESMRSGSSPT